MKLAKTLIAATALAFTAGANADWVDGGTFGTEGELILTVWNSNTQTAFSQDLGVGSAAYMNGNATDDVFNLDVEGIAHVGGVGASSSVFWNVYGVNTNNTAYGVAGIGYYFSGPPAAGGLTAGQFTSTGLSWTNAYETLVEGGSQTGTSTADDPTYLTSGSVHAGSSTWGAGYGNFNAAMGLNAVQEGADGQTIGGFVVRHPNVDPVAQVTPGFWTLDLALGTLSFSTGPTGEVPVPAAVWLFGSALLGLGGAIRRRKAQTA